MSRLNTLKWSQKRQRVNIMIMLTSMRARNIMKVLTSLKSHLQY